MTSIHFIINPISGKGKNRKLVSAIQNHRLLKGIDFEIFVTKSKKHAKQLAIDAAYTNISIVVAVGGDGTIHDIGTQLIGTNTALAIIPTGSGNGLARSLNVFSTKLDICLNQILKGNKQLIDTLSINTLPFLNVAGLGYDALIAHKFDEGNKRGILTYIKLVIKHFFLFNGIKTNLSSKPIFLVSICNSSQWGNNVYISPNSTLDDGLFEICYIKPFPIWAIFKILYQLLAKSITNSRYYNSITVSDNFEIECFKTRKIFLHLDGEPYKISSNNLSISIQKKSLYVII